MTASEWEYIWQAACARGRVSDQLIIGLAYFASLKLTELAPIQMNSFYRVAYTAHPEGIWSVAIESRAQQRRQVFLIPPVVDVLATVLGVSADGLVSFIETNGETYLLDLLNNPGQRKRVGSTVAPKAPQLVSRTKAVFLEASRLAAQSGDQVAAARLQGAPLSWLTDAFELHMRAAGIEQTVLWRFVGACKQIPESLRGYMPDRMTLPPDVLKQHIKILMAVRY